MNDDGYIDDETLSLAISLYEEYRNHRISTALMGAIVQLLKDKGFIQISLLYRKGIMQLICTEKQELRWLIKTKKNIQ